MQRAVELAQGGLTLRGMEHVPDSASRPCPVVVICHGFTADKLGPHQLLRKLSLALEGVGIASVRFDFAGSGESDGRFQDVTVSGEIADANAIVDFVRQDSRFDPSQVMLVGHSVGGLVASLVAADRPDDVARLGLIAPAGNLREFVFGLAQQAGLKADSLQADTFDWGGFLVGRTFAFDLLTLEPYMRAKLFKKPVLLVHGSEDGTVPSQISLKYRDEVYGNQAEVRVISGANHTFDNHAWETEVIQSLTAFLRADTDTGRPAMANEQA
ncbi:alpha/beta hydrolase [Alicyclobacillus sp. ALC3]|uniref:alpha/beta hydrolase n=1 Tax=Alicyclobacillus sp. ALC3 TaxID=2796143 RepID=UPI0023794E56|nr:alpha/beta fold hydrolase [Alicyclobacillus sp. ALC3]WDL98726.1 alpha/beta fold hydrolase [Alicyclobacillus sp. ALC3]